MARQKTKQEIGFGDLTFEVQKLTDAQYQHGKDSEQYKKQHAVSVKVVKELNAIYGAGYANLSSARACIAARYRFEKEKAKEDLLKGLKNKKV